MSIQEIMINCFDSNKNNRLKKDFLSSDFDIFSLLGIDRID